MFLPELGRNGHLLGAMASVGPRVVRYQSNLKLGQKGKSEQHTLGTWVCLPKWGQAVSSGLRKVLSPCPSNACLTCAINQGYCCWPVFCGCGSKLTRRGYAGVGPWIPFTRVLFWYRFLSHSLVNRKVTQNWLSLLEQKV